MILFLLENKQIEIAHIFTEGFIKIQTNSSCLFALKMYLESY